MGYLGPPRVSIRVPITSSYGVKLREGWVIDAGTSDVTAGRGPGIQESRQPQEAAKDRTQVESQSPSVTLCKCLLTFCSPVKPILYLWPVRASIFVDLDCLE